MTTLQQQVPDDADPAGILEVRLHAEGQYARKLWIEAPGSGFYPVRINQQLLDERRHFPAMEGRFVFKHAVTRMPEVLLDEAARGGRLRPGQLVAMTTFGSGFSWSSAVARW